MFSSIFYIFPHRNKQFAPNIPQKSNVESEETEDKGESLDDTDDRLIIDFPEDSPERRQAGDNTSNVLQDEPTSMSNQGPSSCGNEVDSTEKTLPAERNGEKRSHEEDNIKSLASSTDIKVEPCSTATKNDEKSEFKQESVTDKPKEVSAIGSGIKKSTAKSSNKSDDTSLQPLHSQV